MWGRSVGESGQIGKPVKYLAKYGGGQTGGSEAIHRTLGKFKHNL